MLKILNKASVSAEIFLAGNREMRFLNKKFRGKDKPTDVLSFKEPKNFPHPEFQKRKGKGGEVKVIGEIYLNMTRINADINADKRGLSISENQRAYQRESACLRLLAHGLLHLLGYSHKKKSDRMKMERKEKNLLANF